MQLAPLFTKPFVVGNLLTTIEYFEKNSLCFALQICILSKGQKKLFVNKKSEKEICKQTQPVSSENSRTYLNRRQKK